MVLSAHVVQLLLLKLPMTLKDGLPSEACRACCRTWLKRSLVTSVPDWTPEIISEVPEEWPWVLGFSMRAALWSAGQCQGSGWLTLRDGLGSSSSTVTQGSWVGAGGAARGSGSGLWVKLSSSTESPSDRKPPGMSQYEVEGVLREEESAPCSSVSPATQCKTKTITFTRAE